MFQLSSVYYWRHPVIIIFSPYCCIKGHVCTTNEAAKIWLLMQHQSKLAWSWVKGENPEILCHNLFRTVQLIWGSSLFWFVEVNWARQGVRNSSKHLHFILVNPGFFCTGKYSSKNKQTKKHDFLKWLRNQTDLGSNMMPFPIWPKKYGSTT